MSAAGRSDASAPAESLAAAVRDAGFVRLVATADGDALAALGVLARALRATDVPFQASASRFPRDAATETDVTVAVGADDADADVALTDDPLSVTADAAARALVGDDRAAADALLALAGAVAAGSTPGRDAPPFEAAEALLERRPGVALPVADLADGLAHSTLVHAAFSGDPEAAGMALADLGVAADLDADAHRRLASMVALRVVDGAADRAAVAVERALRPYAGGPFATLGGYADVLDACARVAPGTGVALAVGAAGAGGAEGRGRSGADAGETRATPLHAAALDAWREHGRAAHAALRRAETARHDGVFVVRAGADAPLETVARLAHAFRSPEPLVVAYGAAPSGSERPASGASASGASGSGAGIQAAAHGEGAAAAVRRGAAATGAVATGRGGSGYARDVDDERAFTDAVRGGG